MMFMYASKIVFFNNFMSVNSWCDSLDMYWHFLIGGDFSVIYFHLQWFFSFNLNVA